jgi:NMD protein affecting ribosome stability and mRNA decay
MNEFNVNAVKPVRFFVCKGCSVKFEPKRIEQRFCSLKCQKEYRKENGWFAPKTKRVSLESLLDKAEKDRFHKRGKHKVFFNPSISLETHNKIHSLIGRLERFRCSL